MCALSVRSLFLVIAFPPQKYDASAAKAMDDSAVLPDVNALRAFVSDCTPESLTVRDNSCRCSATCTLCCVCVSVCLCV